MYGTNTAIVLYRRQKFAGSPLERGTRELEGPSVRPGSAAYRTRLGGVERRPESAAEAAVASASIAIVVQRSMTYLL